MSAGGVSDALEISFDFERIDIEETSRLIAQSYWGMGRTAAHNRVAFEHSICVSAFLDGKQVGFGRAITDHAIFAHISDILVWPDHRGKGIGIRMMEALLGHPVIAPLPSLALNTADAHGLYEKFGFVRISDGMHMKRIRPLPASEE